MLSTKRLQTVAITNQYAPKGSAEAIANNNDLLAEILLRLPVKSLLRFKSVSKAWYAFISHPNFSRRVLSDSLIGFFFTRVNSLQREYEFLRLSDKPFDNAPFMSLTFDDNPCGLKILQSCSGLLCCSSVYAYSNKHDYYIYNPTTQQFRKLPQLAIQDTITVYGVGLVFDPTKSPYYKVVFIREPDAKAEIPERVDQLNEYGCYEIEIYSSQSRSWHVSGKPFVAAIGSNFKGGVYCNGAVHWLNYWETSLYFNVDEEKIGEMPTLPPIPEGWEERRVCYLGESRNHLHLIEIYGPSTTKFNVYEMERNYSCWFVKYHVNLEAMPIAFPEMIRGHFHQSDLHYYTFSILSVVREAKDEVSYMVLHIPGSVIHYNLKDGNFRKICDLAPEDKDMDGNPDHISLIYNLSDVYEFIPTLSSV